MATRKHRRILLGLPGLAMGLLVVWSAIASSAGEAAGSAAGDAIGRALQPHLERLMTPKGRGEFEPDARALLTEEGLADLMRELLAREKQADRDR